MIMPSTAFITICCLASSLLLLSACTWYLFQSQRREAARVARLEDILTRMTRELVQANSRLSKTDRTVRHMVDRQDTLECRTTGGQRIESAVRVARQGAANEAVLKDLGLSDAEASLLLRLHCREAGKPAAPVPDTPAAQAKPPPVDDALVTRQKNDLRRPAAPAEDEIRQLLEPRRASSQAASLARLLAKAEPDPAAA